MSEKLNDLKKKLKEIFQLDQTDLDFGIYRIMNEKSSEITDFLDNKLLPQVKESFSDLANEDKASIQKELNEAIEQAKSLGANPDDLPKVKELKAQLSSSVDLTVLENDVYSHLTSFFSRYYEGGDFMSLRRYKKDVYAIPYEGEEVKLHWANSDQYYIKTSENFKDYTFTIGNDENKQTVHFKLIDAETEKDNNKADKERRFILIDENPIEIIDGELYIKFQYTIDENKKDQKKHNEETISKLLPELSKSEYADYINLLDKKPTEKNKDRTLLEKHLTDYTAKNSFDYFIHKDLGGFLNRELDFYIKNEVLNLDDLDENNIKKSLNKAKAIKKIAQKIITLLVQLEEFQKKLWLKKKMVVETNYCLTLDKVDERFYPEIISNEAQIQEWEELFKISEITADLTKLGGDTLLNGTDNDKKIEFLKQNPYLVLDTKFFSQYFKYDLISTIENLDEQTNGLLINADNFHALNLLQEKYTEQVKCIYIDPPFNLGINGDFIYKTNYKDSSWATLLQNRMQIAKRLLKNDAFNFIRCDYNGNYIVRLLGELLYGQLNFGYELCVSRIRKNVTSQGKISLPIANDSLFLFLNSPNAIFVNPYLQLEKKRDSYWRRIDDSAGFRNPPERCIFGTKFFPYKHDAHFKFSQQTIENMIKQKKIRLKCKECGYEHYEGDWVYCPKCNKQTAIPQYKVEETDKIVLDTNWSDIPGYSSNWGFSTENSEVLLKRALDVCSRENDIVLDYFLGSGTTVAVAIKTNRRWIGIESGKHINTIIIPRLKKIMYGEQSGISKKISWNKKTYIFKYMSLESYEDALNNLHKKETQVALGQDVEEQYKLSYMMDFEYSNSIFNLEMFKNPFDYKMNITIGNETKLVNVDLIETFNYLIGLKVSSMYKKDGFIVVEGTNLKEENILVIWRNIEEKSNEDLDEFLKRRKINPCDFEFNKIYVNGDNNLQNLKTDEENFKVMLIEEEFKNRMFDVKEV